MDWKEALAGQEEFLRPLIREVIEQGMEGEIDDALCVEKGERTSSCQGYRSGYYGRTLVTRSSKLTSRNVERKLQANDRKRSIEKLMVHSED